MSLHQLFAIAAIICFAVPAIKALFNNSFDFTDTGLVFLTLMLVLAP